MKRIEDKVFGRLKYDCNWEMICQITIFERKEDVILSVEGEEDEEIEEMQRTAFIKFEANKNKIVKQIQEKLLEYYQKNYQDIKQKINDEKVEDVLTEVYTIKELGRVMQLVGIKFPYSFGSNVNKVEIFIGCEWEDEDGIGIRVENEEIVEIGSWGILS